MITVLALLALAGCATYDSAPCDIRLATHRDFTLTLSEQTHDAALHLSLQNTSKGRVRHNYLSASFIAWVVHAGQPPVRMFVPGIGMYPNPLPVMEPDEVHDFQIPFEHLGFLQLPKVDLKDSTIFVEYMMADENLLSSSVVFQKDITVGTDWPTNCFTLPRKLGK